MPLRLGRWLAAVTAIAALTAAAGCSGSSAPAPSPSASPTSATPSPQTPAQQLRQLAVLGASAQYHALYAARQRHPASRAKWQVWRTNRSLRVDVMTKRSTATLIVTPRATFSCSRRHGRKACFRVAKAGAPVPVVFRLLAERLFSAAIVQFADHISRFAVTAASTSAGSSGACFAVRAPRGANGGPVETATYCFDGAGVLTAALYPNGNSVRLLKVTMKAPGPRSFVPYSSPTPLPRG